MTGVEELVQSIIGEAEQEASDILREAEQKKAHAKEKAQKAAVHHAGEIVKTAQTKGAEHKQRTLAVYGLELRKELLQVKREAMDTAYETALARLKGLPREEYLALVRKLLLSNVRTGEEAVRISVAEQHIDPAFIESVNTALKASGKTGKLRLSTERAGIQSGFVLESGGLSIDCSFETVIGNLRETTETQVAKILFG